MFIDKLSIQEKKCLVQLLTMVARSDGKLVEQEWHFLNRFCDEYGLTYDINQEYDLEHICGCLVTKSTRIIAMQQVVKMALSDGEYEQQERSAALEISDLLGLERSQFDDIETWVIAGVDWVKQGELMIAQGS